MQRDFRIEAQHPDIPGRAFVEDVFTWADVRYRVPFIRDVCGYTVKIFRRAADGFVRTKAPHRVK